MNCHIEYQFILTISPKDSSLNSLRKLPFRSMLYAHSLPYKISLKQTAVLTNIPLNLTSPITVYSAMETTVVCRRSLILCGNNHVDLPSAPRDTGSMKRKPKGVLPEVTGTRPGRAIFPATKAILDSCTKPLIGNTSCLRLAHVTLVKGFLSTSNPVN